MWMDFLEINKNFDKKYLENYDEYWWVCYSRKMSVNYVNFFFLNFSYDFDRNKNFLEWIKKQKLKVCS